MSEERKPVRIFLCHKEDLKKVLGERLMNVGVELYRNEYKEGPTKGQPVCDGAPEDSDTLILDFSNGQQIEVYAVWRGDVPEIYVEVD